MFLIKQVKCINFKFLAKFESREAKTITFEDWLMQYSQIKTFSF